MGAVCGCNRATAISSKHDLGSTLDSVELIRRNNYKKRVQEASLRDDSKGVEDDSKRVEDDSKSVEDDSKRVEEARRARVEWLEGLRTQCSTDEDFHTARTQSIWTELASSSCSLSSCTPQGPSPAALQRIHEENRLYFYHLVDSQTILDSRCPLKLSKLTRESDFFFQDFEGKLEAGQKIGGGGQASIHEVIYNGEVWADLVLKVFKSDYLLEDLQRTWSTGFWDGGITKAFCSDKYSPLELERMRNCCDLKQGTLLEDGRFAFLLQRCWGDLRKAIDHEIVKDKTYQYSPFKGSMSVDIMFEIALGMRVLHKIGILHRDLKEANCLLRKHPQVQLPHGNACMIADYESSNGVVGTGFWRAPEVLFALKNSNDIEWTEKADVYSYAMTCYEVTTGCIPFEERAANDYDGVIGGERPPLPDYVDSKLRALLRRCWHNEPSSRPTFDKIVHEFTTIYPDIVMRTTLQSYINPEILKLPIIY